jgi:Sec-independent protein translocase protein TatA
VLVALVFLGPKRLMEVSRSLGQGYQRLQEYKEEIKGELIAPTEDEDAEKQPSTVSTSEKKG